jgi:hypothetical protein
MEQTSLAVLQERAMRAEGEDDVRELRCAQEKNAITLRERITSLTNEIVADQLCLAALERAMEDAKWATRGYVTAVSPRAYAELEAEWERATFGARLEDLHAAAPDMLEALKRLVEDGDGISQREYARAAIAKAEGR